METKCCLIDWNGNFDLTFSFLRQKIALLDIACSDDVMMKLHESFPAKTIVFQSTDVTKREELERGFDEIMCKFKSIDCVITCAAILDEINYKRALDVNLVRFLMNFKTLRCDNLRAFRSLPLVVWCDWNQLCSNETYEYWQRT